MANGSIQIYTSAGQAAPLAGVALTVLDENGAALAHLTADADGFAEAADLPRPRRRVQSGRGQLSGAPLRDLQRRGRTGRLANGRAERRAGL